MKYQDAATRVVKLGTLLQENYTLLSGDAPAKVLHALMAQVEKMEAILDTALKKSSPDGARLTALLEANADVLPPKALKDIAKKLEMALPGGAKATPVTSRIKFVEVAVARGVAAKAVEIVEIFVRTCKSPKPDTSSIERLRTTFRNLGAKSEDEIRLEIELNYTDEQARMLARAVGIKHSPKATKKSLLPHIIHYSQRSYENTLY
ncbi:hypothetical protein DB346_18035 [Verrucomicrobia bacterium LW23]|nr:hypothetical protein DB346_18035 [Verrucomicrobia bacterium LW23]